MYFDSVENIQVPFNFFFFVEILQFLYYRCYKMGGGGVLVTWAILNNIYSVIQINYFVTK